MPSLSSFCAVENPGIPFIEGKKERNQEREEFDHLCLWTHLASTHLLHDESCDSSLIGVGVRLCINNEDVGVWPVCDPELVSVQDVVVALGIKCTTRYSTLEIISEVHLLPSGWFFWWTLRTWEENLYWIWLCVVRLWNSAGGELEQCLKHNIFSEQNHENNVVCSRDKLHSNTQQV